MECVHVNHANCVSTLLEETGATKYNKQRRQENKKKKRHRCNLTTERGDEARRASKVQRSGRRREWNDRFWVV